MRLPALLVFLFASSAFAAAVPDTDCVNDSSTSSFTTLVCTFGLHTNSAGSSTGVAVSTASGDFVGCSVQTSSAATITLTDPGGQPYASGSQLTVHWVFQKFWVLSSSSIASVSVTISPQSSIVVACSAWRGGTWTAFDKTAANDNGIGEGDCSGCAFTSGSTATTTQATEFLWGACSDTTAEQPVSYSPGSGWTAGVTTLDDANVFHEWRQVSSTGTYAATGTYSNVASSGSEVGCIIDTFKITIPPPPDGAAVSGGMRSGSRLTAQQ